MLTQISIKLQKTTSFLYSCSMIILLQEKSDFSTFFPYMETHRHGQPQSIVLSRDYLINNKSAKNEIICYNKQKKGLFCFMKYLHTIEATFIERPNRFIAKVDVQGEICTVHVPNTGRCKELFLPGCRVILEQSQNPARKTAASLIAVYKGNRLINIDSQIPHRIAAEALATGTLPGFAAPDFVKQEKTYLDSRLDIYYESALGEKGFIEVKGVTLERDNFVLFPDAPTERGTKHIHHLIKAKEEGYESCIYFIVQMNEADYFTPNRETDPAFADALEKAAAAGVKVLAAVCRVTPDTITVAHEIPVEL